MPDKSVSLLPMLQGMILTPEDAGTLIAIMLTLDEMPGGWEPIERALRLGGMADPETRIAKLRTALYGQERVASV